MVLNISEAQSFFSNWANRFNTRPDSSKNLNFFNFVSFAGRYNPGNPMENFFQNMENALEGSTYGGGDGIDGNLLDKNKYVEKDGIIYCETKQGGYVRMNIETGKVDQLNKDKVLLDLGLNVNAGDEVTFENGQIVVTSIDLFDSNGDDQFKDWTENGDVKIEHNEINLSKLDERIELRNNLDKIGQNANLEQIFGNSFNTDLGIKEMKDANGETVGIFKDNQMATIQYGQAYITYHDGVQWQVVKVSQDNYSQFANLVDQSSLEAALAEVGTEGTDPTTGLKYTKELQFKIENGKVVAYAAKAQEIPDSTKPDNDNDETQEVDDGIETPEEALSRYLDAANNIAKIAVGKEITGDWQGTIGKHESVNLTNLAPNSTVRIDNKKRTGGANSFYIGASQGSTIIITKLSHEDRVILPGNSSDWEISDVERNKRSFGEDDYTIRYYNPILDMTVVVSCRGYDGTWRSSGVRNEKATEHLNSLVDFMDGASGGSVSIENTEEKSTDVPQDTDDEAQSPRPTNPRDRNNNNTPNSRDPRNR